MKQSCLFLILLHPLMSVLAQDSDLEPAYTCMRMGNFSCAAELFEPLAQNGDTRAQFQLGKLYLSGRGVKQSTGQAREWFQLAATADEAPVQYALGLLLLGEDKQAEATGWLEKAAAQDHSAAIAKLEQISSPEAGNSRGSLSKNLQDKWLKATVGCRKDEIKQGLRAGVRVNEPDSYHRTALYYLVACGDKDAVAAVLEKGANPNTVDKYGESPLKLAVRKNEYRIASLLLGAGATVKQTRSADESLLHIAVSQCSEPMVTALLKSKIAHSPTNRDGQTPLDLAVDLQQKSIEKLLVNAGAHHSKHWSSSPQPSSTQTLSYLEEERTSGGGDLWQTAVQAIRHGQTRVLQGLIEKNAGELLTKEDDKHRTLLMYATELQREQCISILVNAGANPRQVNMDGISALMIAAKHDDWPSAQLLISLGANPASQDSLGRNAVHLALMGKHDTTANKLLMTNTLPDARTRSGQTYLMLAIEAGAGKSLKTILKQYSPGDVRDDKYRTALWYAAHSCNAELVEQLLALGASPEVADTLSLSVLHAAVNKDCVPVVRSLLRTGIDPNKISKAGNTALMLAAQQAQTGTVQILLAQKADISVQNKKGDTALLLAVRGNKSREMIAALLEAGGDPYRRNELGESAFSVAEMSHPDILELIKSTRKFNLFGFID